VNHKRVERIWKEEGLKVPKKQPKRRRLWLNDGSCIRLRPTHRDHVWSYDFVMDRTSEGRAFRMLTKSGRALTGVPGDRRRDPSPVSVPVLMRELGNSPRGVSEGGA